MDRRNFLSCLPGLALCGLTSTEALALPAAIEYKRGDRIVLPDTSYLKSPSAPDYYRELLDIRLIRPSTKETFHEYLFHKGELIPEAYDKVCWFLRDQHISRSVAINDRLLLVLIAMQKFLDLYGLHEPISITSAYRSLKTNSRLVGEGAAKNSMHLYGKAADIRIKGLNPEYLSKLALAFQPSGVGMYSASNFLHVDTGHFRADGSSRRWGK